MSDSKDSTVTYTVVSSPFEGFSAITGLCACPEEPEQAPPLLEFVPELVYPEFMPSEDDVLPIEEQPLPTTISPTADLPGYIPEFDLEEDDDEDPNEDPDDYPTDRDDDEEEEEPSRGEADDEDEDEDDEEEEENPASTDSIPLHKAKRFLAIPTSPPSPLTPLSSPLPQIPSPPLLVSPPLPISSPPLPASPTYPLGFRATMIRLRAESPSTSHSPTIHTYLYQRHLWLIWAISGTWLEVCLPPRKRLYIAQGPRYEVEESSSVPRPTRGFRTDYGFVFTLDAEIRRDPKRDVGYGITDTWDEMLGAYEIYKRLDEAQDARAVLSGRLNLLKRNRRSHAYIAFIIGEVEA
ncbi:hypothetical protein Tco_0454219 [Tanacetum coccineum]